MIELAFNNFEPDYEDIKNNPNDIYNKYYDNICKAVFKMVKQRNIDFYDVIGQTYIWFREFAQNYDPYYNECFFPFENYFFYNLYQKINAYSQRSNFVYNREAPVDYHFDWVPDNSIAKEFDEYDIEDYLNDLPGKYKQVIELILKGHTQKELAHVMNLSQARVSVLILHLKLSLLNQPDNWRKGITLNKTIKGILFKAAAKHLGHIKDYQFKNKRLRQGQKTTSKKVSNKL